MKLAWNGIYTGHVSLLQCPFFALFQHICVNISTDDACFTVSVDFLGVVKHSEGDVACAAGDVENAHWLAAGLSARIEGADEMVLPETVNTKRHGVVHNVIRGGDGGEHFGDYLVQIGNVSLSDAVPAACTMGREFDYLFLL